MFGIEKSALASSFREAVEERYQKDLLMNGCITFLVIWMPMILLLILVLLVSFEVQRFDTIDLNQMWEFALLMLECFIIMFFIHRMYTRLSEHSTRDRDWRHTLIQYVNKCGGDSTEMEAIDAEISKKERFHGEWISTILLLVMFAYVTYCFLIYLPTQIADFFNLKNLIPAVILVFLELFVVFIKVLSFPYRHESMQSRFTMEMSAQLSKVGKNVPPMVTIVKHRSIVFHFVLLVITAGFYSLYLLYAVFRTMNNHIMNQWQYETELLKFFESNGKIGFEEGVYQKMAGLDPETSKEEFAKFSRAMRVHARKENRMPLGLVIAELFMVVLCASYMLKMVAIHMEIVAYELTPSLSLDYFTSLPPDIMISHGLFILDMVLLMIALDALLGIASRRPSSWRKVCRSCITFVIPLWISAFVISAGGYTHMFDFNVYLTTGLLYDVLVLMLVSYKIKKFYTPIDPRIPRLRTWVRYIFYGELRGSDASGFMADEPSAVQEEEKTQTVESSGVSFCPKCGRRMPEGFDGESCPDCGYVLSIKDSGDTMRD